MVVTLEVSQISGWLKEYACCRVEGRACNAGGKVRAGRREGPGCGGGTTQAACTGKKRPDSRLGAKGTRGERTANIQYMVLTLEVSKLSGWLKRVTCRVGGRACDAGGERCEPGGGRARGVVAARQAACTGPDSRLGGQGHALERT
jgi:hypothetical protein